MSCGAETTVSNKGFDYIELVGRKVQLRPTTAADAAPAYRLIHGNQNILRWLCWNGPQDKQELTHTYSHRWPDEMRQGSKYSFAIEEKGKPGIIGCIDARCNKHPRQMEVGYWLGVPYWNHDYMSEAIALICHLCFTHLRAIRLTAQVFAGNEKSQRVLEKNGFRLDGTIRRHVLKGEIWKDAWFMTLLAEEWQKIGFKPQSEKLVPHKAAGREPISGDSQKP